MTEEAKLTWSDVLLLVRQIAPTEGWAFTSRDLVAAGVEKNEAAKWLTKFVDWGYLRRGEFEEEAGAFGKRPHRLYHMLKRGLERELGGKSDITRLMEAIQAVRDCVEDKEFQKKISELYRVQDQVSEAIKTRFQKKG